MLQPVPVLFQRFRIVPGDFLRQERDKRDKGERHHHCLSEEARINRTKILKVNSRRAPCALAICAPTGFYTELNDRLRSR